MEIPQDSPEDIIIGNEDSPVELRQAGGDFIALIWRGCFVDKIVDPVNSVYTSVDHDKLGDIDFIIKSLNDLFEWIASKSDTIIAQSLVPLRFGKIKVLDKEGAKVEHLGARQQRIDGKSISAWINNASEIVGRSRNDKWVEFKKAFKASWDKLVQQGRSEESPLNDYQKAVLNNMSDPSFVNNNTLVAEENGEARFYQIDIA
jgi:hypothetical protein